MAPFQRPAEGTWTEHYPELGTGPVSFEESISPALYELEREPISRTWPASCGTSAPDGVQNIRPLVIGRNRFRYARLMGQKITAQMARDWGAVNEVLPKAELMDRAWDIARYLLRFSPIVLRHTRR
ncbi:MAG TPA: enoyl-CoA hydratase-related protein, partial [Rectinemataceae bacterium]|nr:enoyl-CoA hydratase-related protein [Rectinemataceae bacterium]